MNSQVDLCVQIKEEAGYKRAAPRAELMFKIHMAYMRGRMTNFARALYTW